VALASRALLETEFVVRGWALKSVDSLRFAASSAARLYIELLSVLVLI
jgi:hypothetical protein